MQKSGAYILMFFGEMKVDCGAALPVSASDCAKPEE
jgi:hypothetical protein